MNFVLHMNFRSFLDVLIPDINVYLIAFSQPSRATPPQDTSYVLASTDRGVEGGTIHAFLIRLKDKTTDIKVGNLAKDAFETMESYLKRNQISVHDGIIATDGLDDLIERWRHLGGYTIEQVHDFLDDAKVGAKAEAKPRVKPERKNERRRNQNNK